MYKQTNYVAALLFIFLATNASFANNPDAATGYIEQFKDLAISEMHRSGVPASITLAQGILESSSGQGELAVNSNNHFGIKCKEEWGGLTFDYKDDDYDENGVLLESCFRSYDEAKHSYEDHSNFLRNRVRYAVLFTLERTDYVAWARGLKECGYATDPTYASKLIGLIERYKLYQYDTIEPMNEADLQTALPATEEAIENETNGPATIELIQPFGPVDEPAKAEEMPIDFSNPPAPTMLPEGYQRNDGKVGYNNMEKQGIYLVAQATKEVAISPLKAAPSSNADNALPIGDNNAYVIGAPSYNIDSYTVIDKNSMVEKGGALQSAMKQQQRNVRIMSHVPKSRKVSRR